MMTLLSEKGVLVMRSQTGPEDDYGNPTWVTTETPVTCNVQPRDSTENYPMPKGTWQGWFPPGTPVDQSDALWLDDGRRFEIDGPARPWVNPRTSQEHHVEVDLIRAADAEDESEESS